MLSSTKRRKKVIVVWYSRILSFVASFVKACAVAYPSRVLWCQSDLYFFLLDGMIAAVKKRISMLP